MATSLEQTNLAQSGDSRAAELRFFVFEADTFEIAYDYAVAQIGTGIPEAVGDRVLLDLFAAPVSDFHQIYEVVAKYEIPQASEVNDGAPSVPLTAEYNFGTSLTSQHISRSLETMDFKSISADGDDDIPDFGGKINVQPDGSVSGVDIDVPTSTFGLSFQVPAWQLTFDYQRLVEDTVGTVNSVGFAGRAAGTCLFAGVSGRVNASKVDAPWDLTMNFLYRKNRSVTLGTAEVQFDVKGWELLWVYYKEVETVLDTTKKVELFPHAAYVERVYETTDLEANLFGSLQTT